VVAGESGAGKSSLLRAGLMPWLAAGALGPGSERWPRRVIQPTGRPVRELAMALAEVAGADPVSVPHDVTAGCETRMRCVGMLALIAGTVSYLYMHRACESDGNVSESPRVRASSQLNRA